jgi:hypothetical protein
MSVPEGMNGHAKNSARCHLLTDAVEKVAVSIGIDQLSDF